MAVDYVYCALCSRPRDFEPNLNFVFGFKISFLIYIIYNMYYIYNIYYILYIIIYIIYYNIYYLLRASLVFLLVKVHGLENNSSEAHKR